ncbi:hypothetical protein C4T38_11810 [Clostridioides difficile]|nr:hypothetical protein [Clostridioides difficile]
MKSVLYFFAFFSLNAGILRADWSVSGVVVAEDKKRSKHRECSHTPEKRPAPPAGLRPFLLVGEVPKPL